MTSEDPRTSPGTLSVPWYRSLNLRIGGTIAVGILITSTLVSGRMVIRATERHDAERVLELTSSANVLAASLSEAIAAKDQKMIERVLRSIGYSQQIKAGEVFDAEGERLATMGAQATLTSERAASDAKLPMTVRVDVRHSGRVVGAIRLVSATTANRGAVAADLRETILWGLLAALLGSGIAIIHQRRMLEPLQDLTAKMMAGRMDGETHKVAIDGRGEVGVLVASYNRMIDQIEARDAELVGHRDRLEDLVDERTKDLRAARVEAERATAAKSRFLAAMSHEIRTPMNGVLVMAEMLARSDLPPAQKSYADVISRSGSSLLGVLNDILDFSKAEAGRLDTESIPMSIDDCVSDTVTLFWQRARESGLALTATVDPAVPAQLFSDPTRLRQCLSNLIGNAIKFTEKGAVSVEVTWAPDADTSGTLTIAVRDTGQGIPSDRLTEIFDEFAQADQSTTRKHGGTGLGLSITKHLVTAMGGEITVQSKENSGSTFTLTMPTEIDTPATTPQDAIDLIVDVDIPDPFERAALIHSLHARGVRTEDPERAACRITSINAAPRNVPSLPTIGVWPLGEDEPASLLRDGTLVDVLRTPYNRAAIDGLIERIATNDYRGDSALIASDDHAAGGLPQYGTAKVLAADDNEANRQVIASALGIYGITPELYSDGLDALEAIRETRFDLILLDGDMPGLDGYEAARQIRAVQPSGPVGTGIPLVLFTASAFESDERLLEMGFSAFLAKPFEVQQLGAILERFCTPSHTINNAALENATVPVSTGPVDGEVLSRSVLHTMRQLDDARPGTLANIFERSISTMPDALDRIDGSWRAGDSDMVRQAAHALRSVSGTVGATRLSKLASDLELKAQIAAKTGEKVIFDPVQLEEISDAVLQAINRLQIEIDQRVRVA